ncbi:MAG: DUF547 domain-containing protein [Methylococcales bacterium]|nr:DUF547 domain-containing protein [Methylococcales bacterium]
MPIEKTLILMLCSLFLVSTVMAKEPDWTNYQTVLTQIKVGVKNKIALMQVDYLAIKNNGSLDKAYQQLSAFNVEQLSNRQQKLAFYINAYNILALKMVADHWPTESIKDVGGLFSPVWDKPAGVLAGKTVTLGEIEHKILRPMAEPRIHLAIVCASVSCPDLRNEPYTAKQLDDQLDDQTRRFLNNQGKGLRLENNVLRISKIFDWFEQDFKVYGGVAAFIKRYKTDLPAVKIKSNLNYDWNVNSK